MAWWKDFYRIWSIVNEEDPLQKLETKEWHPSKRIILTGIGGFVGSHILDYLLKNTDWEIIGIDSFRHKGTFQRVVENIPEDKRERVQIFIHDLTVPIDAQLENLILEEKHAPKNCGVTMGDIVDIRCGRPCGRSSINYIFNLASNSAVERSNSDPVSCLRNNYDIAINMLEFARKNPVDLFVQFSTDEVYGEAAAGEAHKEWAPILPSNPYAASKAAQEAVAISYWRTFNMPIVITNAANIIGERQDSEKFLPKIIQKISKQESMPIYGDSVESIGSRSYIHGYNVADALVFLTKREPAFYSEFVKAGAYAAAQPDRYNICGDQELNNLELAQMVAELSFGDKEALVWHLVPSEEARTGYDRRYALDGSKLASLGWKPPMTLKESLERVVGWAYKNKHWVK